MHVPIKIKQDSDEWSYILKHKDIIEETEFIFTDQSCVSTTIDS